MVPNHQPAIKITIKSPMEKEAFDAPNHQPVIGMHWDALKLALIFILYFWGDDTDSSNRKLTLNNTQQQE